METQAKEAISPPALLEKAITSGATVDVLERLLALQERWEALQARKAFEFALADLRKDLPTIVKDRQVDFTTASKGHTHYKYEDLSTITEVLSPIMASRGLSFRWRTQSTGDVVIVACVISHEYGHSEETSLAAKHDHSGNKNDIQAIGSAVTYLQRYTLKAALGVAAAADDDGQAAGPRRTEPQQASPTGPNVLSNPIVGFVQDIKEQRGANKAGNPWTRYSVQVAGTIFSTFDTKLSDVADRARNNHQEIRIAWAEIALKDGRKAYNIETLEIAPKEPDGVLDPEDQQWLNEPGAEG